MRVLLLLLTVASTLLAQSYTAATVAGRTRIFTGSDVSTSMLRDPRGLAVDAAGNLYIADKADHRVFRLGTDGKYTILAGTGVAGFSGDGGPGTSAQLNIPETVAVDGQGNLFIADRGNRRIRRVNLATRVITTYAGNGASNASTNIEGLATDIATDACCIAADTAGNLYIAEFIVHRIRKVSVADGRMRTIAGTSVAGFSGDNGLAIAAQVNRPMGISVDQNGKIYFADANNNRVRRIDQNTGVITTIAGNGQRGIQPALEGPALSVALDFDLNTDATYPEPNGDVLIGTDRFIKRLTASDGMLRNFAGNLGVFGSGGDGGPEDLAEFQNIAYPIRLPNGDVVFSDIENARVRRIRNGIVGTAAGIIPETAIAATAAALSGPTSAVPFNGGFLIADPGTRRIRKVTGTTIATQIAYEGVVAFPASLAQDADGFLYVIHNSFVYRIARDETAITQGTITILAGDGTGFANTLNNPVAAIPGDPGTIYIADRFNCRVQVVTGRNMTTLAGSGAPPFPLDCGYGGDNNVGTQAKLTPMDVALDGQGNLLVADLGHRIRKINLATKVITTIAGTGTQGFAGDGGQAASAQLNAPTGVAVDIAGNIFVADNGNKRVRMITPNGVIRTIAGNGETFNVETGTGLVVAMEPFRLAVEQGGAILVVDQFNDRVRRLTPVIPTAMTVVSGNNQSGGSGTKVNLVVKVTQNNGDPVGSALVSFSVTQGAATLSAPSALTDATGTTTIQATLGNAGAVRVTASLSGVQSIVFNLTATAGPPAPAIDSGGVVGAGLSFPAVQSLSTNGIASVFGSNFGGGTTFQKVAGSDLVNGRVPTVFKGICVEVAGTKAPVFGASNTQVNFQAPVITPPGQLSVIVITGCGTATEQRSNAINVTARGASPEFFYFAFRADGHNPVAATDSITGAILVAPDQFPGAGFKAAKAGGYVTVYGTGFGATNPAVSPGEFPAVLASTAGTVRVLLNGTPLPAANVLYAGVTPNSPGLFQLNIQLPVNTAVGELSLVIEVGGVQSSAGGYLTVAAP